MNKSFAESVLPYLKDKQVEVYANSSSLERRYSDFEVTQKEVIRGILKDASGDMFVIEISSVDGYSTNTVFVNCWHVTSIIEPKNNISLTECYVDEHKKQPK